MAEAQINDLARAACRLKRSSPQYWEEFLKEFAMYRDKVTATVIASPPADILKVQGHAQQCLALERAFHDCEIIYARSTAPGNTPARS